MKELLYREIPTPDQAAVVAWLQQLDLKPTLGSSHPTPNGLRIEADPHRIVIFTWSLQNTTYLKVIQSSDQPFPQQQRWLDHLCQQIQSHYPPRYPDLPAINLAHDSIFTALEPYYPLTVHYFQRIPQGETDLQRVYWWEKRWRQEVQTGRIQAGEPALLQQDPPAEADSVSDPTWDLVVVGGALGAIYAATMAQLGYAVALVERLPFGRMNREWNISRREIQTLVDLGLFSSSEIESLILREYRDGFNKFFDGNSPIKAPILHTPTVLNLAIDAERLLHMCGEKLTSAGGTILDRTEFQQAFITPDAITIKLQHRDSQDVSYLRSRLLVDAMGTASPVTQQLNHYRAFDSVCPTVGATIRSGFDPGVWDSSLGDILASHGDISRGRQLIWELFPGPNQELTFYLFHYHEVHPDNPGSLLEMYEDFFTILPEYRRCDVDRLEWKKATFGYIPGRFGPRSKAVQPLAYDRVLTIGDAAAMQSPLSFTGFGSLVRNAPRLAELTDVALRHDLLKAQDLQRVRAFQDNSAVTWLFSRGMMVPTGRTLPPAQINTILNSFFGILAAEPPEVADAFIKDRAGWWDFTRMALRTARQNPRLLVWIWQVVGFAGFRAWFPHYLRYTGAALISFLCWSWVPGWIRSWQSRLEGWNPRLWHTLLSWSYSLTYGHGHPQIEFRIPVTSRSSSPDHVDPQASSASSDPNHQQQGSDESEVELGSRANA